MKMKNGYVPSILETWEGEDFFYNYIINTQTVRHEIFFGTGNRKISKANGFWVNVTPNVHKMIHENRDLDLALKCLCQRKYEETHTRDDFMRLIGRNYL